MEAIFYPHTFSIMTTLEAGIFGVGTIYSLELKYLLEKIKKRIVRKSRFCRWIFEKYAWLTSMFHNYQCINRRNSANCNGEKYIDFSEKRINSEDSIF